MAGEERYICLSGREEGSFMESCGRVASGRSVFLVWVGGAWEWRYVQQGFSESALEKLGLRAAGSATCQTDP